MESLDHWIGRQYRYAARAMLKSISPVAIVRERPGFGQVIRPQRGAIVASPVPGSYDPDPDYFFHWYRDSAIVIDALRVLFESGTLGEEALAHVNDFVRFSLSLGKLDGRTLVSSAGWRGRVAEEFRQYLRDDVELAAVHGDAVAADTRVNPDGTLDILRWCRPQHDGPALRALALLRWMGSAPRDADFRAGAEALIRADLALAFRHWREPSFDIWEEEQGQHYYTLCVTAAALAEGADWLEARGDAQTAETYRAEARTIRLVLDGFWDEAQRYYRSRRLAGGQPSTKSLDVSVILAAIHTASDANAHAARDPRMHATLARLEALFDATYPINHHRGEGRGVALGRYAGDVYYSGGAWYLATLGAAELCFRAAAGREDALDWRTRGDAFLATVRAFTPPGGEMSEQFDSRTGEPRSAKHLAWSYAAFITCVAARRAASGA